MPLIFIQNFRLHKNVLDLIYISCSCGDLDPQLSAGTAPFMVLKKWIPVPLLSWKMKFRI